MLSKKIEILGKDNYVDPTARNVQVIGDNNQVLGNINNVLIVADGQTVTESNTIIIDGNFQLSNSSGNSTSTEYITSAGTTQADVNVKHYLIDTTAGNITLDWRVAIQDGDLYDGYEVYITKIAQSGTLTLDPNAYQINGKNTVKMKRKYSTIHLRYDGMQDFYII